MDWEQAIREERAMLIRIVALLLSLAGLAERASGHFLVASRLLLLLLRPAEVATREFVLGSSDAWPMEIVRSGDARTDMVHLAMRLRELACLLLSEAELALSYRPQSNTRSEAQPCGWSTRVADVCMMLGLVPLQPAPDTS